MCLCAEHIWHITSFCVDLEFLNNAFFGYKILRVDDLMGPLKFVVNGIVSCSLISSLKHFLFAMTEEQV